MLRQVVIFATLLIGAGCASFETETRYKPEFKWPEGKKAAIALTYDDALASQLDVALPQLDERGLKGTFYLIGDAGTVVNRPEEWRSAAENGHELGNKTMFLPCRKSVATREFVHPANDLDTYSMKRILDEVVMANDVLSEIDDKETRTFAYPCGESMTAEGSFYQQIKPLFVGARAVNDLPEEYKVEGFDPYNIQAIQVRGKSIDEIIENIENTTSYGGFRTLIFYGVGENHHAIDSEMHAAILDYLVENEDTYWVDTVESITSYAKAQKSGVVTAD